MPVPGLSGPCTHWPRHVVRASARSRILGSLLWNPAGLPVVASSAEVPRSYETGILTMLSKTTKTLALSFLIIEKHPKINQWTKNDRLVSPCFSILSMTARNALAVPFPSCCSVHPMQGSPVPRRISWCARKPPPSVSYSPRNSLETSARLSTFCLLAIEKLTSPKMPCCSKRTVF